MAAVVEDLLRLAWQANADGRAGMCDALLTLAVAESGADDAVLAERCRKLLVARRPGHCFAGPTPLGHALTRPKVAETLGKLRSMYPPVRVRHLLLRGGAAGGPYTSPALPLWRVLEDLALDRKVAADVVYGRDLRPERGAARALPFLGPNPPQDGAQWGLGRDETVDPDGSLAQFYLTVLFAIAVLLDGVLRPASSDTRAA